MTKAETALIEGARILAGTCAGVTGQDVVCILADSSTDAVAQYVARAVEERGPASVTVDLLEAAAMHGTEPPAEIAARIEAADVVFCLTRMSMAHTQARKALTDRGGRFLSLPDYSLDLLAAPSLRCDFVGLVSRSERIAELLTSASRVSVTTSLGTRLDLDITGRSANSCPGLCRTPGSLCSPPDAEVNIAPLEGIADGFIAVDGSIPFPTLGRLSETIGIRIERGAIAGWEGPPQVAAALERIYGEFSQPEARVLAEFGIGLNPNASLSGRMLEDEGTAGTVHFGFGSNITIGGRNRAAVHLDMVVTKPTVLADETQILRDGVFAV